MGDKNESEPSCSGGSDGSGGSSSSSESSSGSSEGEEEVMETVCIMGHTLELPQDLCEDYGIFKEFFSMRTWDALSDEHKEHLKTFLPKFPENEEDEKETTIKMLFNHEPFHFTSPLGDFYNNLRQGNYRPDIAKMRKFLKKARAKQQRHRLKSYYAKLLPEVLISRERLLAAVKAAPPGPTPRLPLLPPKPSVKNKFKPVYIRARQRYFEELAAIRSEVGGDESDDENYPEGPPEECFGKRKTLGAHGQNIDVNVTGTLGGSDSSLPTSLECLRNVLSAHRARRQYRDNHPELNIAGITLEEIKERVALVNGAKKLMFGGQKSEGPIQKLKRGPKKEPKQFKIQDAKGGKKKEELLEGIENKPLLPNIKIKCEQEESDSETSSFVDPVASPKPSKRPFENIEIKQEVMDVKYPNMANINYNEPMLESVIKQEPQDPMTPMQSAGGRLIQHVPIKLEDLDGIDMMALPVEIADDSGEVVVNTSTEMADDGLLDPDEALTETTHANFLSLVRALFPARSAHRASKQQLHARCLAVMRSPIAALNTWYSLADDWCAELDSALDFLAGERGPHPDDFVPYLQFMPETQMYQWIGAGRDCDAILSRLCERWLRTSSPPPPTEPAPPKYPTSWVVRPASSTEIVDFRAQERRRFSAAAKPFTYVQYGYRSVVGPCARASLSCAGQGALLAADRPRHASFLALVRDAVARLPNGEGTRHDVLTLLKMSQWIAPCTDQALLGAVSSALDRLHSAKRDPMVKYDQRTAVWTYLHRHRSEEDWLKSSAGRGRGSKAALSPGALAAPPPPAPPPPRALRDHHPSPPHAMDMEVASVEEVVDNGSDTDVDVDDSGSPTVVPHLSSAQLLMQATQCQVKQMQVPNKPKGKLVAVSPQKTKNVSKQTNQAKQANLILQAKQASATPVTKQASAPAQSTKPTNLNAQPKENVPAHMAKKPNAPPQVPKQINLASQTQKQANLSTPKQTNLVTQVPKQPSLMAQSAKQANAIAQLTKQTMAKQNVVQSKQCTVVKQAAQSPKQTAAKQASVQPVKQTQLLKQTAAPGTKQDSQKPVQVPKAPSVIAPPHKSPLIKQRPLQKQAETSQMPTPGVQGTNTAQIPTVIHSTPTVSIQNPNKVAPGTRSLLIRAPTIQTTSAPAISIPASQTTTTQRRGVVRVLSPATPSGKSLISPRALMQQGTPTPKKRVSMQEETSVTTVAQSAANVTTVVSSVPSIATAATSTRTVQLAGGRTVQLAANQTVHLPGGQAVQLSTGHTLQLSSLQLPTHSVRLPSGQTVQLASPQAVQAVRAVSTAATKAASPRAQPSSPTVKTSQTSTVHIPISSVQLAGQTVQIAGQTVQLAGQSVQLTGHTVKLPSGQSVQVASQSVLPSQSVQLPSGQTVQLAGGNVQTVQLGQNVLSNSNVQVPGHVQLSGQTVQLAGGQTVQLPSGQTLQLSGGQTVQLSSGQTLQLASGQTVQLTNPQAKPVAQVARSQPPTEKTAQPIVAKLLTNAQGQMISLEGGVAGGRALQMSGVRMLSPAARVSRPLLLAAGKPLHNIILQQSDGSAIRVTSTGGASTSQAIVISNIGAQTATTSTTAAPVLKLQQAVSSTTVPTSTVRSVLMDGQQLKLVGGRHVLARILRPAHPPPQ